MKKLFKLIKAPLKTLEKLEQLEKIQQEMVKVQENQYRDILELLINQNTLWRNSTIHLETQHPVAYESLDHLNPLGTIQDNTRHYRFYKKCLECFDENLAFLDLGCSGGGLVFDFALKGHIAIGLEGSDHSEKSGRANWRTIPENLMTCNIAKPFKLKNEKKETQKFDIISCWEVLEHIHEKDLPILLDNVVAHLDQKGMFVGSISKDALDPLHVTIKEENWWKSLFASNGLNLTTGYDNNFKFEDFCRGVNGGMYDSFNYKENPERGFHFVAKKLK